MNILKTVDDANSELATDDFHFEEKFNSEKIRERNHKIKQDDDFPPPPQPASIKVDYFENNKLKKVENSFVRSWKDVKPVDSRKGFFMKSTFLLFSLFSG